MTDDIMARPDGTDSQGVPAGMKAWAGGDGPPADWDDNTVLNRDGLKWRPLATSTFGWRWNPDRPDEDIVAYTPLAATSSPDTPRTSTPAS